MVEQNEETYRNGVDVRLMARKSLLAHAIANIPKLENKKVRLLLYLQLLDEVPWQKRRKLQRRKFACQERAKVT